MTVILCSGLHLSFCENLNCIFQNVNYGQFIDVLYSCKVESLDNSVNNLIIDGFTGAHKSNKYNNDVKGISIQNTNTKFIPANLGSLFNLTALRIENTIGQMVEIHEKHFRGMPELESLSLYNNKLTSVPADAFTTLTKLRLIHLSINRIEILPYGLFSNNLNLEKIYLYDNKIKYIGSELFNGLSKLNLLELRGNVCVRKDYGGSTAIIQSKIEIKINCFNPFEVQLNQLNLEIKELKKELSETVEDKQNNAIELNKVITEKDLLTRSLQRQEVQLNELMNVFSKLKEHNRISEMEFKLQLLEASNKQQTEFSENIKLRDELSNAKYEKKKEQDEKFEVLKEKDSLKEENVDLNKKMLLALETIEQKVPKMEQEVNELQKELLEMKQQSQTDKIVSGELRGKLIKANEQLAKCEIDERNSF